MKAWTDMYYVRKLKKARVHVSKDNAPQSTYTIPDKVTDGLLLSTVWNVFLVKSYLENHNNKIPTKNSLFLFWSREICASTSALHHYTNTFLLLDVVMQTPGWKL